MCMSSVIIVLTPHFFHDYDPIGTTNLCGITLPFRGLKCHFKGVIETKGIKPKDVRADSFSWFSKSRLTIGTIGIALLFNLPSIFEDASINQQQTVIPINLELWGSRRPCAVF